MTRRLVLFDIDGTLITDGGAARSAFASALASVYRYDGNLALYDFSGCTDPQITTTVLRDAGWSLQDIHARMPALWDAYLAGLRRNATADRVRVLAGIPALLDALADRPSVTLGLLTGNIEPGARLKLEPPALNDYFPFGAFGSDSADRTELPPIAIHRACEADGHRFSGADVVIIGDSIYDVRCGVPHNSTTIAVASGKTPPEKLRAENPHHFFESAEDLGPLMDAILGKGSVS